MSDLISERLTHILRDHRRERIVIAALLLSMCDNYTDLMTDLEIAAAQRHKKHNKREVTELLQDVAVLAEDILPVVRSFIERNK